MDSRIRELKECQEQTLKMLQGVDEQDREYFMNSELVSIYHRGHAEYPTKNLSTDKPGE
jgi:homoserine trans-succinylase